LVLGYCNRTLFSRRSLANTALALALIGSRAFADPMLSRVAGAEAKCVGDNFSRPTITADAPLCRRGGKNGRTSAGTPRLQLPRVWEMTAASAWEAFPAPGLSAAVSGTRQPSFARPFANAGGGDAVPNAKLDGRSGAPQTGQSASAPKWSFTGDLGIPNNQSLDDVLRQQYRGPAAMDNESVAEKLVNSIGALKLGIKVDY
jgi:hypothetical protein